MRILTLSFIFLCCNLIIKAQPSGYLGKTTLFYAETGIGISISKLATLDKKVPFFNQNFSFGVQRTVNNHLTLGFTYSAQTYIRDNFKNLKDARLTRLDNTPTQQQLDDFGYSIEFKDDGYYTEALNHQFKFLISKSKDYIAPVGRFKSLELGFSYAKIKMMHEDFAEPFQLDSVRTVVSPTLGYSFYVQKPLIGNLFIRYGWTVNLNLKGFVRALYDTGEYDIIKYKELSDWRILQHGMRENIIFDGLFKVNLGIGFLAF